MSQSNLSVASRQWAEREPSARFWNPADLIRHLTPLMQKGSCKVIGQPKNDITDPDIESDYPLTLGELTPVFDAPPVFDAKGNVETGGNILVKGPNPQAPAYSMTHHSMSQLCAMAQVPASLVQERLGLRHPQLALDLLTTTLSDRKDDKVKVLIQRTGPNASPQIRAITGVGYSRIWDRDIMRVLDQAMSHGWMIPPARPADSSDPRIRPATQADLLPGVGAGGGMGVSVGDPIAPAGCYYDDRSSFTLLVNPKRVIDTGDDNGGLWQAVMVGNSEVGGKPFWTLDCLLEGICGNHICWGVSAISKVKIIHRGDAQYRWQGELLKALDRYSEEDLTRQTETIKAAKRLILGADDKEVMETLYGNKRINLSQRVLLAGIEIAKKHTDASGADPKSAWAMVEALTRYSQLSPYADERHRIDVAAGVLLSMAS